MDVRSSCSSLRFLAWWDLIDVTVCLCCVVGHLDFAVLLREYLIVSSSFEICLSVCAKKVKPLF